MPDDIRGWFRALPIDPQATVSLFWLFDGDGVRLGYDQFVSFYDDLWYPSADDVWIVDQSLTWVLELDHEEIFTFFRREVEGARSPQ